MVRGEVYGHVHPSVWGVYLQHRCGEVCRKVNHSETDDRPLDVHHRGLLCEEKLTMKKRKSG